MFYKRILKQIYKFIFRGDKDLPFDKLYINDDYLLKNLGGDLSLRNFADNAYLYFRCEGLLLPPDTFLYESGSRLIIRNFADSAFKSVSMGASLMMDGAAIMLYDSGTNNLRLGNNGIIAVSLPSFTDIERGSITPANGMMIYNTDFNEMQIYINGGWVKVTTDIVSSA